MTGQDRHPLEADRVREAVALLRDAFLDANPGFTDLWPDRAVRRRATAALLAVPLRDAHAHGCVDVASSDDDALAGVAVWYPPGSYPMSWRRRLRALPRLARLAAAAPRAAPRAARFGANVDAAFGARRAWYLSALGVAPARQGEGIGSALLLAGLERVDADGSAAYLETGLQRNVPLYERHGFVVEDPAAPLLPDGPTQWLMQRPAS